MFRNKQFYIGTAINVVAGILAILASIAQIKIVLVILVPVVVVGAILQFIGLGKLHARTQEIDEKWQKLLKQ